MMILMTRGDKGCLDWPKKWYRDPFILHLVAGCLVGSTREIRSAVLDSMGLPQDKRYRSFFYHQPFIPMNDFAVILPNRMETEMLFKLEDPKRAEDTFFKKTTPKERANADEPFYRKIKRKGR